MLIGRKAELYKDLDQIQNILLENNISDNMDENDIIYILEDGSSIIGVCKLINNGQFGLLEYIIISKQHRGENYGDSLLRGAFNYCVRRGISKIYYPEENGYLQKIGFAKLDSIDVSSEIKDTTTSDKILICDLIDFFSKGCSSCKGRG